MTLNGYYFAATGVTEYAFFHGDTNVFCVSPEAQPGAPVRVRVASGAAYAFPLSPDWNGVRPVPGASYPFLDGDNAEIGRLYLLAADRYAVAMPGGALTGRIITERLRRSVLLTGLDEELVARMEYGLERILSRERFGEWFPRRYLADVTRHVDEPLLSLAMAVPFLGFDGIEVR